MVAELKAQGSIQLIRNSVKIEQFASGDYDLVNNNLAGGIQNFTTTASLIKVHQFVGTGTPAWAMFANMSTTNTLKVGIDNTGTINAFWRIKPQEFVVGKMRFYNFDDLKAQAVSGTAELFFYFWESTASV